MKCGGRDSNPHCREPHPRASCQLGYHRECLLASTALAEGGFEPPTSRSGIENHSLQCRAPLPIWATQPTSVLHWPGRELNPQLLELKSSASASWATRPVDARTFRAIDQGGSRTHTVSVLSAAPLPIGLPGRLPPSVFRDVHSPCGELESLPANR